MSSWVLGLSVSFHDSLKQISPSRSQLLQRVRISVCKSICHPSRCRYPLLLRHREFVSCISLLLLGWISLFSLSSCARASLLSLLSSANKSDVLSSGIFHSLNLSRGSISQSGLICQSGHLYNWKGKARISLLFCLAHLSLSLPVIRLLLSQSVRNHNPFLPLPLVLLALLESRNS